MGEFSMAHILIVGALVLILFGSKKQPEFGKSLGKSIKSFKEGLSEIDAESKEIKTDQIAKQDQAPHDQKVERKNADLTSKNKS